MPNLKEILGRVSPQLPTGAQAGGRPPAAVEFAPAGVLGAALPASGPAAWAVAPLAEGALAPSLTEPNLRRADQVAAALKTVLDALNPRKRALTLVLPDALVRVFVLDFDSLPSKAAEVLPVLRFRLRKMVPFEVEHAAVSYQILTESRSETRVLAAILPGAVLAEYESLIRQADHEPGAVLPSTLAALAAAPPEGPVLVANLDAHSLTTAIAVGDDLRLYRTLDLPTDDAARLAEAQRGIAVAAAFYEDTLGARPTTLHYAGLGTSSGSGTGSAAVEFGRWLNDPELAVADLVARPETGFLTPFGPLNPAPVAGALVGAA